MGKMLVFTNAVDGRDDEFNAWYDEVHVKEVVATPPFTAATRFRVADAQMADPGHRYLAIYEFEGPAQGALDALMAAAPTYRMSEALAMDARVVLVEDL